MNRPKFTKKDCMSFVMESNLFTKGVAVKRDPRQAVPDKPYTIPDTATRLLLAKLIFEEAMETISDLGCRFLEDGTFSELTVDEECSDKLDINGIIDGCCDTIYVCTGALAAMGVPDLPHLIEVCRANNDKFPGGEAIINPTTGKYLKPEGWKAPDHDKVRNNYIDILTGDQE